MSDENGEQRRRRERGADDISPSRDIAHNDK
jgi:hypothetical protein